MVKKSKRKNNKIVIITPTFEQGRIYAVQSLDHFSFTRNDIDIHTKHIFFNFVGLYVEDSEFYHVFLSFEYSDENKERLEILAPQRTFILKNTIVNYNTFKNLNENEL